MPSNTTPDLAAPQMSAIYESAKMIFHLLVAVFLFGFALLLGILSVMRGLYAFGVCQRPVPSDPAATVSLVDGSEQPPRSWSTGGLTANRDFES
jgi:hypothetical protein